MLEDLKTIGQFAAFISIFGFAFYSMFKDVKNIDNLIGMLKELGQRYKWAPIRSLGILTTGYKGKFHNYNVHLESVTNNNSDDLSGELYIRADLIKPSPAKIVLYKPLDREVQIGMSHGEKIKEKESIIGSSCTLRAKDKNKALE